MNDIAMPPISILIPCFNAEQWIEQAIRSALDQTWANKEVIVVDDGSTDGSLEIIRSFGTAIRFEAGPNRGGNVARNRLLELANGEWLQYLDADDYLLPEKIEQQFRQVSSQPQVDVIYSPVILEYWTQNKSRIQKPARNQSFDLWVSLIRWFLPQTGAVLWRKSALIDVGAWRPDQPCCQEHELYFRLLLAGKLFQYCPIPGAVYRQWSDVTVCHRNPLQTLFQRLQIVDSSDAHLEGIGQLNDARRDAIFFARLECARSIYQFDQAAALRVADAARRRHPTYKLPPADCFPVAYRRVYQIAGFRTAERTAQLTRHWRSIARFRYGKNRNRCEHKS